ncbi:hypothetical protein Tco_0462897 [Tanacetum coccineum]
MTDDAIRNQEASIKTLEIQIGKISKVQQETGFGSLPSSTETNPRDQVKSFSTTIEADSYSIRKEEGNYGPKFMKAYGASHINYTIPRKEKELGRASVSVMPLLTYLNLGLGELAHIKLTLELADRTVKYPKGIAKNVLVGIGALNECALSLLEPFYVMNDFASFRGLLDCLSMCRGMGDVIVVNLTYQMVRSHPRFKRHTNEQCNKNPPLLMVSEKDEKNGISHAYQKLKGLYKGVLNLGPNYIRDAKMEEWITRGHINVHEME